MKKTFPMNGQLLGFDLNPINLVWERMKKQRRRNPTALRDVADAFA